MAHQKKKGHLEECTEMQVKILRHDPTSGIDPYWQIYKIPLQTGVSVSVLLILQSIFENQDHSLAFIGPCEKGLCGMCTVVVNGKTQLACNTYLSCDVTIEPLKGFNIIRDLVVDRNRTTM
jgi:succinate dehydrogenase/fumarate reductase iron-sulfur protein